MTERQPPAGAVDRRRIRMTSTGRAPLFYVASGAFYAVVFATALWALWRQGPVAPAAKPGAVLSAARRPMYHSLLGHVGPRMPWEPRIGAIARVLRRQTGGDSLTSERVAAAIVREADRTRLSPSLLTGVVLVENTTLKPDARNQRTGATGLMQVMPFHAGKLGCGSRDLTDVDANICHGTRILADLVHAHASVDRALLGYNGCVARRRGAACRRYPDHVFESAAMVRRELARLRANATPQLHYLEGAIAGGTP